MTRSLLWRIAGGVLLLTGALQANLPDATDERAEMVAEPKTQSLNQWLQLPASQMVRVPESTFTMGSMEEERALAASECALASGHPCEIAMLQDEGPRRVVTVSSFWLDRLEVTGAEYQRCVELGYCSAIPEYATLQNSNLERLPMTFVSWQDAHDYCAFRGARLPTEAEFELAARGVSGRTYPWGDFYNAHVANHGRSLPLGLGWGDIYNLEILYGKQLPYPAERGYAVSGADDTDGFLQLAPVGSFPAGTTPEGIHDLAGNAAEWVYDRYAARYSLSAARDPKGPKRDIGSARVVRGGDYLSGPAHLRGAARRAAHPRWRLPYIGFRCARSAAPR